MSIVSIILQSVVLLLLTRAGTKSSRRSRFEDYQNGESQRGTANSGQDANRGQKRSCGHALSIRFTKSDRNSDESSSYKPMNSQNMHYKGK